MDPGFALEKLAERLLEPSVLMLELSLVGALALRTRRRRAGGWLLGLALAAELACAVLPIGFWLGAPLEDRFPACLDAPADLAGIVVLGGAVEPAIAASRGTTALNGAAERMTQFVIEARRHPGVRLAFTGGSGAAFGRGRLTEADVAHRLFDGLGLAGRDILYEDRSRTTWENARDLARLAHPSPAGPPWLLITSALHMPRAVAAFRAAGWHVLADPVAYQGAPGFAASFAAPYPEHLGRLDSAMHEWLGLAVYRVLGRTRRLLPTPSGESCR